MMEGFSWSSRYELESFKAEEIGEWDWLITEAAGSGAVLID